MLRPLRPTALASLLVMLACATAPEPEPGGTTSASSQTGPSTSQPDAKDPALATAEHPQPSVGAPVQVASAPADDARPCERMCGRVGDCLRERGDASEASLLRDAGHLELTCLDLCVNIDTTNPVAQRFRDCEHHQTCDPLLDCTRGEWDAAAAARGTVAVQIDAAPSYDTCELVCGGMYACMYHQQPLHQLQAQDRGDQFERDLETCVSSCDPVAETMIQLASCAHEPTCDGQWKCWERAQGF